MTLEDQRAQMADAFRRQRSPEGMTHRPRRAPMDMSGQDWLDFAALSTAPLPVVGDVTGLAADASMLYNEPESRTPLNFLLATLGLIPGVPAVSAFSKKGMDFVKKQVERPKSRATLIHMSPDEFLEMAERAKPSREKTERVAKIWEEKGEFEDVPMLKFENEGEGFAKVTGHEGRHRARKLKAEGIKSMPVVFHSTEGGKGPAIRWGSQDDPMDRVDVWPHTLKSQDYKNVSDPELNQLLNKRKTMPFPESDIFSRVQDEANKLKAWHGSPYDFDEFKMSQIGTGEGAQAYGKGMYFAEAEEVAKGYQDALGKYPDNYMDAINEADRVAMLRRHGANPKIRDLGDEQLNSIVSNAVDDPSFQGIGGSSAAHNEFMDRYLPKGHMYEVEIDVQPEELLDWDKPLSEQPDILDKAVSATGKSTDELKELNKRYEKVSELLVEADYDDPVLQAEWDELLSSPARRVGEVLSDMEKPVSKWGYDAASKQTGEKLIEALGKHDQATPMLSGQGVKGIKYKDGFSRGAEGGTSNFVIFDERLISISKKYGISIPAAAAIVASMDQAEQEAI